MTLTSTSNTYDTKNVGTNKTVTASGIYISSATNGSVQVYGYQVTPSSASANIGKITPAPLTITVSNANDYNITLTPGDFLITFPFQIPQIVFPEILQLLQELHGAPIETYLESGAGQHSDDSLIIDLAA